MLTLAGLSALGMHMVMSASAIKLKYAIVTGNLPYLAHHEVYKVTMHAVRPLLFWHPLGR
jgi:hypothetical protein